jgi:hypothetical protein
LGQAFCLSGRYIVVQSLFKESFVMTQVALQTVGVDPGVLNGAHQI